MRIASTLLAAAMIAAPGLAETPAPAPAPAAAAPAAIEKLICRSRLETGSLVKRKRTCLTAAQWRYADEANNSAAAKMIQDHASATAGN
jgi:hypothetical protein